MASYIWDSFHSHRFQLLATSVLSGAAAVSLLLSYQALARAEKVSELKKSIPSASEGHHSQQVCDGWTRHARGPLNLTIPAAEQLWRKCVCRRQGGCEESGPGKACPGRRL